MADVTDFDDVMVVGNPVFDMPTEQQPKVLVERFFARTLLAAQTAQRQGYPITLEGLAQVWPYMPREKVRELLATPRFVAACEEQGINISGNPALSPRQMAMVAIYLDTSNPASLTQKLRMGGVSRVEWDGWMLQAPFAEQVAALSEDRVKQLTPLATARLEQAIDRGEAWAIQFGLGMTGRYDPRKQDADPAAAIREIRAALDAVLPQEMLQRVLDYLQAKREGRDPEAVAITVAPSTPAAATMGESAPPA